MNIEASLTARKVEINVIPLMLHIHVQIVFLVFDVKQQYCLILLCDLCAQFIQKEVEQPQRSTAMPVKGSALFHITNFGSFPPRRLHIKFGFDWPSGFKAEGWTMMDGRRLNGYTISSPEPISSPCEPNGSDELITQPVLAPRGRTSLRTEIP